MQIKADPVHLKAFLNVMKSELCPANPNKRDVLKNENKLIRAFGSSSMPIDVVTKMTISERSDLPPKGFPRTLKELSLCNVGYSQMPIGILNLSNLTTLDLSNNKLTKLPKHLGNLKLNKLILANNKLGDSNLLKDWDWVSGENMRRTLTCLSITRNGLKFILASIFKCARISNLDASCNEVTQIPFAIKLMSQLKTLNLSNNKLSSLPYTIIKPFFEIIDLSSNCFPSEANIQEIIHTSHKEMSTHHYRAPSLLELSSRAAIKHKIPFMSHNLPPIIKDILFHSPLCSNSKCEVLCFDMKIFKNINLIQLNSKQRITSDNASYFNSDGPFCSRSCSQNVFTKLFRNRNA